jgi:beta-glucosidase
VPLDARAFMYFDVQANKWHADAGTFDVLVGSSSAKIEAQGEITLRQALSL